MDETINRSITVSTSINLPIEKVWRLWTNPEHIREWNNMSADWHCPKVENDLRLGGRFLYVMALKDGSLSFDFVGTYEQIIVNELISYRLDDDRTSTIVFKDGREVTISETFEPEDTQPDEMQKQFCAAILASFKRYANSNH
jgi:uncharacterized protein YndB with AHSA1/START domain